MLDDLAFVIYRYRDRDLCDLVEELWTYRLMPRFFQALSQLASLRTLAWIDEVSPALNDDLASEVARILGKYRTITRIDCPCCQCTANSRFVKQVDNGDSASVLCYLCEACGNILRVVPIAESGMREELASQVNQMPAAPLQVRPPREPIPDPVEEMISQLSVRVEHLLSRSNFDLDGVAPFGKAALDRLCDVSVNDFLSHRGSGAVPLQELREKLLRFGRTLKGDEKFLEDYLATHFLNAIYAALDDDQPRLKFAAWLEDNGMPQGELIRTQIELEHVAEVDPRFPELKRRESDLLGYYSWRWLGRFYDCCELGPITFRRGFPEKVDVEPQSDDLCIISDLLNAFPTICSVRFKCVDLKHQADFYDDPKEHYAGILRQPWLRKISTLCIAGNCIEDPSVIAIAESKHATSLRMLNLSRNNIGNLGADKLASSPYLTELRELNLEENPIDDEAASRLRHRFGDRVKLRYGWRPTTSKWWAAEHGHQGED